ncbi:6495_t:CDS:1, partial [Cetraspora pellucida]
MQPSIKKQKNENKSNKKLSHQACAHKNKKLRCEQKHNEILCKPEANIEFFSDLTLNRKAISININNMIFNLTL